MNGAIVVITWFSFLGPAWPPTFRWPPAAAWPLFGYLALSHLLLLAAVWGVSRALRLDWPTPPHLFVAPQNTLSTYFAAMPDQLGLALDSAPHLIACHL